MLLQGMIIISKVKATIMLKKNTTKFLVGAGGQNWKTFPDFVVFPESKEPLSLPSDSCTQKKKTIK